MTESPQRASDADREAAARTLQDALADGRLTLAEFEERSRDVYRTTTRGELAGLTADVVEVAPRRVSKSSSGSAWAVFGDAKRGGRWTVPTRFTVTALMGSAKLDLRDATLAGREVTVSARTLCGSVLIIVPDDLAVQVDGVGLFGSYENKVPGDGRGGRGSLRVTGVAAMGSVQVRRARPHERHP